MAAAYQFYHVVRSIVPEWDNTTTKWQELIHWIGDVHGKPIQVEYQNETKFMYLKTENRFTEILPVW